MKNTLYLLLAFSLYNCGSIPKYRDDNLKPITNVKEIEGEYRNYASDSLKLHHLSLNGEINWRKKDFDTTQFSSVKIKILNDKQLKLDFIFEKKILKSRIINYRLRHNGFIKLRSKNFRISGIPLIIGEYEVRKYELSLNQNNDLILHGIDDQAGGLLIILSAGFALEVNTVFKKV